ARVRLAARRRELQVCLERRRAEYAPAGDRARQPALPLRRLCPPPGALPRASGSGGAAAALGSQTGTSAEAGGHVTDSSARPPALRRVFVILGVALGLLASGSGVASAKPEPAPLNLLPIDKLQSLAPLLRNADVALLESSPQEHIKQLTTIS